MTSLYLIDGHNVLYRTFFGLPRLSAPDGTPTNVVLGTARILLKILREEKPSAIAAVFDSPEPTPRHDLYPEYKANRLKVPEDLLAQIPVVKDVIDALGVQRIEVPGAEADDIIGTLSRLAEEKGMEVVIVSSDKDLYQLVSRKVRIRDGLKEKTVGEEEVRETFGVGPGQVAELLALSGDPSDNVPGVPGIGEKTASGLIREFGTVENLLANTGSLKGKQREKIEKNAEIARLCRQLAEIDRNVPVRQGIDELAPRGIDRERAAHLFRRLGFRKLLDLAAVFAVRRIRSAPPEGRKAGGAGRGIVLRNRGRRAIPGGYRHVGGQGRGYCGSGSRPRDLDPSGTGRPGSDSPGRRDGGNGLSVRREKVPEEVWRPPIRRQGAGHVRPAGRRLSSCPG
jgi:5'-3' exonuclease